MSEPNHPKLLFRGQAEADLAFSRASDRPFHGWIGVALVFFVFGVSLFLLDAPIAQPLGVIVAAGFCALGVLAMISGFLARPLIERQGQGKAGPVLWTLGPAIWAGASVALLAAVVGFILH